jgi:drug/metabolite transporter (DMT)-like permease
MTERRPDPADRTPTSNPVLRRALAWGGILAAIVLVVSGILGLVFAGAGGLVSALVGTLMAVVFMGITAASILLANRFASSDVFVGAFFGIVLGGWLLKFIVFIVLVIVLRDAPWLNPTVLFLSLVAGVIASLVVDVLVVAKSRIPYASDVRLPKAPSDD